MAVTKKVIEPFKKKVGVIFFQPEAQSQTVRRWAIKIWDLDTQLDQVCGSTGTTFLAHTYMSCQLPSCRLAGPMTKPTMKESEQKALLWPLAILFICYPIMIPFLMDWFEGKSTGNHRFSH